MQIVENTVYSIHCKLETHRSLLYVLILRESPRFGMVKKGVNARFNSNLICYLQQSHAVKFQLIQGHVSVGSAKEQGFV